MAEAFYARPSLEEPEPLVGGLVAGRWVSLSSRFDGGGGLCVHAPVTSEQEELADRCAHLHDRAERSSLATAVKQRGTIACCVLGRRIYGFNVRRQRELLGRSEGRRIGCRLGSRGNDEHSRQVRRGHAQHDGHRHDRHDHDGRRPPLPVHPNSCRMAVTAVRRTSDGKSHPASGTVIGTE